MTQSEIDTGFAGLHGRGRKKQDAPIERELYLTLEEVYKGCTKKMKISRRVSEVATLHKIVCFECFLMRFSGGNPS